MICFHRGPVFSRETLLYSLENHCPGTQKAPKGYPEGSQSQLRRASFQRGPQSGLKTVKQLFRGTPLHAKSSKVLRLPTKIEPRGTQKDTEHTEGHRGTQRDADAFPTHEVLLRAPLLHAPGARMTVVEPTLLKD